MKAGKAYAVFYCKEALDKVSAELPAVRQMVEAPGSLQLYIVEVVKLEGMEKTRLLPPEAGTAYAMWVEHPGAGNKEAAGELAAILNQLFLSPLYSEGDAFA